jgi:Protein of unknown function (DUF2716)
VDLDRLAIMVATLVRPALQGPSGDGVARAVSPPAGAGTGRPRKRSKLHAGTRTGASTRHDQAMATMPSGWQALPGDEHDRVWDMFETTFRFQPSMNPAHWPGIVEPSPSVTWDLALDRGEVVDGWHKGRWSWGVDDVRVNMVLIAAWKSILAPSDWLYVLDWQHPGYRCWPHRVGPPNTPNTMPVGAFPDADYYVYLSPELRLGTFGHPWEASLCVWGDQLIDAVATVDRDCLTHILRRNGVAAAADL